MCKPVHDYYVQVLCLKLREKDAFIFLGSYSNVIHYLIFLHYFFYNNFFYRFFSLTGEHDQLILTGNILYEAVPNSCTHLHKHFFKQEKK